MFYEPPSIVSLGRLLLQSTDVNKYKSAGKFKCKFTDLRMDLTKLCLSPVKKKVNKCLVHDTRYKSSEKLFKFTQNSWEKIKQARYLAQFLIIYYRKSRETKTPGDQVVPGYNLMVKSISLVADL